MGVAVSAENLPGVAKASVHPNLREEGIKELWSQFLVSGEQCLTCFVSSDSNHLLQALVLPACCKALEVLQGSNINYKSVQHSAQFRVAFLMLSQLIQSNNNSNSSLLSLTGNSNIADPCLKVQGKFIRSWSKSRFGRGWLGVILALKYLWALS